MMDDKRKELILKKSLTIMVAGVFVILLAMFHLSCSDDSGGGSSGSSSSATLDGANVDKTLDYIVETIPGCSQQGALVTANQAVLDAVSIMKEQVVEKKVSLVPSSNAFDPAAEVTEPINFQGTCGGSMSGELTGDDATGDISGDISFDNFCQGEIGSSVVIDGDLSFSGNIDLEAEELEINNLNGSSEGITITVDEGGEQRVYIVSFNASLSMSGDSVSITIKNFAFVDQAEGTEVKLQNFTMTVTEGASSTSLTMSGTIDVTDQGSVTFETVGPITVSNDGQTMTGTIKVSGADNTQILVSIDDGVLTVQADTDGDGTYDYYPDALDCTGVALDDISF
jgi:hypothetical protein